MLGCAPGILRDGAARLLRMRAEGQDVDGRDEPDHDGGGAIASPPAMTVPSTLYASRDLKRFLLDVRCREPREPLSRMGEGRG